MEVFSGAGSTGRDVNVPSVRLACIPARALGRVYFTSHSALFFANAFFIMQLSPGKVSRRKSVKTKNRLERIQPERR